MHDEPFSENDAEMPPPPEYLGEDEEDLQTDGTRADPFRCVRCGGRFRAGNLLFRVKQGKRMAIHYLESGDPTSRATPVQAIRSFRVSVGRLERLRAARS